jgi:hypothetical protein
MAYAQPTKEVLELAQISFEGNITPRNWKTHLKYPNGRVHLPALIVLSELVYWYRPTIEEIDGKIVYRKKFKGSKLQKSYSQLELSTGLTKKQVREGCGFLQEKGIITLDLNKRFVTPKGQKLGNVMFIAIHPAAIKEITFKGIEEAENKEEAATPMPSMTEGCVTQGIGCVTDGRAYTKITPEISDPEMVLNRNMNERSQSCENSQHDQEEEFGQGQENQEPVESSSRSLLKKQPDGRSKREISSETNTAPAAKKSTARVRSELASSRSIVIKNKINDAGWLEMSRSPRFKFARAIAIRRMSYQLTMLWSSCRFGDLVGNQRQIIAGDRVKLENECYKNSTQDCEDGFTPMKFLELRDHAFELKLISQDVFNDLLAAIFENSVEWLKEQKANAKLFLERKSMVDLFYDDDRALLEQIQAQHE